MMTNAAYARAIAGYQAVAALGQSPADVALKLHQRLYALVASARSADEQNRLDVMVARLGEASQVLSVMRNDMDFKSIGPAGIELSRLYANLHRQIRRIGMLPKGDRNWASVSDVIQKMVSAMLDESQSKQMN